MKYILKVEMIRRGITDVEFYNPDSILLIHHRGLVSRQENAKRFNSFSEARAALDKVVELAKKEYFALSPMNELSGYPRAEEQRLRESARILTVEK